MWLILLLVLPRVFSYSIHHGVYFDEPSVATTVTATHNIVLKLNLTTALVHVKHVRQSIVDAVQSAPRGNPFTPHFVAELQSLSRTMNDQLRDLEAYVKTGQVMGRTKRTPFLGAVVANILGLPTSDEIDDLVVQINKHETKEREVLNRAVSAIAVTNKQVSRLTKASNKAALAVTALRGHVKKLDESLVKINTNLVMAQALNFIEFSVEKTVNEINRLLSLLDRIKITRRVIPELLNPDDLENILNLI